jgi:16S rRNA (guanine527-N7)-methyltransferase
VPALKWDQGVVAERDAVHQWLLEHVIVSRETLEAFDTYAALLSKWSERINLVGPSTIDHLWTRHIVDCAQLLLAAGPAAKRWVDFGSGAGLPGLVIGTLLRDDPDARVILIEPSKKRCAFLREATRATGACVEIRDEKVETAVPERVDIVTARAFTSLDRLLGYSEPWLALGGKGLFPKGEDVQNELHAASTNWSFRHRISSSLSDARGCILEVEGLTRVDYG